MGHPHLKTPNIDRIAAEGTLFRQCYTSSPICMPARVTMFTGHTNRVTGMVDNMEGTRPFARGLPTLPGLLAGAGYRTHAVGKLHLQGVGKPEVDSDAEAAENPERRVYWDWPGHRKGTRYRHFPGNYLGLQSVELANGHVNYIYGDYVTWLEEQSPGAYAGYACNNADPHPLAISPELHYNTWIADRSIEFIRKEGQTGKPFFLWCSFPDPHEPFAAVKKWSDAYDDVEIELPRNTLELSPDSRSGTMTRAGIGTEVLDPELVKKSIRQTYGMVSHLDEQVGRVLDCLEEQGIADDTVVIFLSDHGDQLGEHGLFYKSVYPYNAHTHIPFVVKVPDARQKGRMVDNVVSLLDLFPTVLDLAGVSYPQDAPCPVSLPGEVLTPVVRGTADPVRKTALIEVDRLNTPVGILQMRTLVVSDYKLVSYPLHGEVMLFDRRNDPLELTNLAGREESQAVLNDMLKQLKLELDRTGMPSLTPSAPG
jgi:arylsulfatase A-like enzyme